MLEQTAKIYLFRCAGISIEFFNDADVHIIPECNYREERLGVVRVIVCIFYLF